MNERVVNGYKGSRNFINVSTFKLAVPFVAAVI